jgi:hypothetical protein
MNLILSGNLLARVGFYLLAASRPTILETSKHPKLTAQQCEQTLDKRPTYNVIEGSRDSATTVTGARNRGS